MILTATTILRKTPLFLPRSSILSPPRNFTSISPNPLQSFNSIFSNRQLGFPGLTKKQMGQGYSRVSAISGGGSGGSSGGNDGGVFGGSSDDGAGGEGDGGNQSKWGLFAWYMDLLVKSPVLTKSVTSALLNLVGDLICQLAIDKVASPDYKRTFTFTFLGLVLVGPTLHYWYLYLSKLVTVPGASGVFLRLILDQFFFAPIFIGTFLSTLITLEGRPSQVVPKLRQEWFSSVIANWKLWIPFQLLNFGFVPQQFQVLASNFVAVIWNVILSFKAHTAVVTK
ncbi:protein sym-1 [Spinacia oleracea]|uniref:Protein sym-1 n=1 Tax=Spinacia oleracea TaxID=3562 RepID=A0A9R0JZQ8_SPIOL|nr:protein sym-1 [Spinacia oleracea]XP_021853121.1 protein sym-1 [Spinacia oleracea]